jgi:hypothetical protein
LADVDAGDAERAGEGLRSISIDDGCARSLADLATD